jgi:hypothetical protein
MKMRNELGLKDPEKKVMRNTYLNGFKPEIPKIPYKEKDKFRHIKYSYS